MPAINVSGDGKDWFDEFKEESENQGEAFDRMRKIVEAYNGNPVDHEELADELVMKLGAQIENNAFRGAKDGVESNLKGVTTYEGP